MQNKYVKSAAWILITCIRHIKKLINDNECLADYLPDSMDWTTAQVSVENTILTEDDDRREDACSSVCNMGVVMLCSAFHLWLIACLYGLFWIILTSPVVFLFSIHLRNPSVWYTMFSAGVLYHASTSKLLEHVLRNFVPTTIAIGRLMCDVWAFTLESYENDLNDRSRNDWYLNVIWKLVCFYHHSV